MVSLKQLHEYTFLLCSYINQRNRLRNLEDAAEAGKREVQEMKTAKADPFTRRACRPTIVTKVKHIFRGVYVTG